MSVRDCNILSDPPFKDINSRFTTVLLNAFVWRSINYISIFNRFFFNCGFFTEVTCVLLEEKTYELSAFSKFISGKKDEK